MASSVNVLFVLAATIGSMMLPGVVCQDNEGAMDDQDIEDELNENQLRALHGLMDGDKNGRISLGEVLDFAKGTGQRIAAKDVATVMDEIDTSKDGKLSLEEHIADIKAEADKGDEEEQEELAHRIEVETAKFRAADRSGDDALHPDELTGLFYPETHSGVLSVTVKETLRQKDKNGDAKLSPQEFWEADLADGDDGQLTEEEKADFKKLDKNGDGVLELAEIDAWESGRYHTEEAMQKLFEVADKDSDMHLTADELVKAREEIALSDAQYHMIEWSEHHEL